MALLFTGMEFGISVDGVSYTPVGCVTGYSLDGAARSEIDTTCSTSTSKEFVFGLRDNGTLSLDIAYDPEGTGNALVKDSYASDVPYYFEVEYANSAGTSGTVKTFVGYVVAIGENGTVDDKISGTIEIKVTGDITQIAPSV